MKQIVLLFFAFSGAWVFADYVSHNNDSASGHTFQDTVCGYYELNYYGVKNGGVSITVWPSPKKNPNSYAMAILDRSVADAIDRSNRCLCVDETYSDRLVWKVGKNSYYAFEESPARGIHACSGKGR